MAPLTILTKNCTDVLAWGALNGGIPALVSRTCLSALVLREAHQRLTLGHCDAPHPALVIG